MLSRHSTMHRRLMLEWLRDCADQGRPFPTDAEIVERFTLASEESARVLLADLADGGHIRLTGARGDRVIDLVERGAVFRNPAALVPSGERLPPPVRKPDRQVDALAAKIIRLRTASGNTANPRPIAARVTKAKATATPAAEPKEETMPKDQTAAAQTGETKLTSLIREHGGSLDAVFADLLARAASAPAAGEVEALVARAEAAEARAVAAEGKLETLKAIFA